jgi:hypothetical protein
MSRKEWAGPDSILDHRQSGTTITVAVQTMECA